MHCCRQRRSIRIVQFKISRTLLKRHPFTFAAVAALLAVLALAIYFPLSTMLLESLRIVDPQTGSKGFSLVHFARFFSLRSPESLQALSGSLKISLLSVLLSALVGVPLAVLFTRFRFPGQKLFGVLATLPMLLPPLVGVIAFFILMDETGIVPRALQHLLATASPPLVMRGVPAILLVHTYSFYVFFYLLTRNALAGLDHSLEEAALGLGASRWRLWFGVILPQLRPALIGAAMLVFMNSMASFTAPYLFRDDWRFLSLEIYNAKLKGDLPLAMAQSVVLASISIVFVFVLRWYGNRHALGRGSKGVAAPARVLTGRGQKLALTVAGSIITLLLMLPQLTLLLMAFVKNGTWTSAILPDTFTTENFLELFRSRKTAEPWMNSLWMSATATALGTVMALAAVLVAHRGKRLPPGTSALLEISVMLPWAVPGTVIAMALIVAFITPHWFTAGHTLVGTSAIMVLAYFVRHLPIQFRATAAAHAQLDPALDEAAQNLGAGGWTAFRRVTLPLILPGVITGTVTAFVIALGEFVSSILLFTPSNRPLSVAIFSELRDFDLGSVAAYSILLAVLIGATLALAQKFQGQQQPGLTT